LFSSQAALLALVAHASDPAEADRLRFLVSPAGKIVAFLAPHFMPFEVV
jgi:hypothetical protein